MATTYKSTVKQSDSAIILSYPFYRIPLIKLDMKIKLYLLRLTAGLLVIASFAMCAKQTLKVENLPATTPSSSAGVADTTGKTTDSVKMPVNTALPITTCSYTVLASQWMVDGASIAPGAVICIPAGTRGALLFKNLKGTAAKPIIIINKGGKVTFSTAVTASYAFKTQNCQYVKVLGSGTAGIKYGFDVNGGNIGMTMDDLSSDFEIANVEVRNSGFAGIMAKTDPSCNVATQRGRFTMKNVTIHDNYVHNTGGEGLYIGNSFYATGVSTSCGTALPHDVVSLKVYNNTTEQTGCEGIQVGGAVSGCEVYNNVVKTPGIKPFASAQNNGIQLGEGTGGKCYNNLIKDAPGNGIIVLGLGDNLVFNNIIIRANGHGIFADSRYTPGQNFAFINNTIVSPAMSGIRLNSTSIPMNTAVNNVIINPGSGQYISKMNSSVKLTSSNNYQGSDLSECAFVNFAGDDFHLQGKSPLINAGANVLSYGIVFDYYKKLRPSGLSYDIGATEY